MRTNVAILKIPLLCMILLVIGCAPGGSSAPAAAMTLETSLLQWQVIGEGSDFLTLMVPVPAAEADHLTLKGVVLYEQDRPIRHVSAIAITSEHAPIGHKWLSFVVYAPAGVPEALRTSSVIELTLQSTRSQVQRAYRFPYAKIWGATGQPEIYDPPVPPQDIAGVLQLHDYTFVGSGHGRKAQGPTVSGYISGRDGRWWRFTPTSTAIQGEAVSSAALMLMHDRGWMELSDGQTHSDREARGPRPPYVRGWWDGKGVFYPEGAIVH